MKAKDEVFTDARGLILRMQNEFPKNAMIAILVDNGTELKNTHLKLLCFFGIHASIFLFVCASAERHC
jgi:hypothetical protein